jgi:hypothetical protein
MFSLNIQNTRNRFLIISFFSSVVIVEKTIVRKEKKTL